MPNYHQNMCSETNCMLVARWVKLPYLTQLYSHTGDVNYLIRNNIRLFIAGITCNVCLHHTRQARWVNVISICKPIMKYHSLKSTTICSLKDLTRNSNLLRSNHSFRPANTDDSWRWQNSNFKHSAMVVADIERSNSEQPVNWDESIAIHCCMTQLMGPQGLHR